MLGHDFLCITGAGCIRNSDPLSPFWFTVGQDFSDSSQHSAGRVYRGVGFKLCDYTFPR